MNSPHNCHHALLTLFISYIWTARSSSDNTFLGGVLIADTSSVVHYDTRVEDIELSVRSHPPRIALNRVMQSTLSLLHIRFKRGWRAILGSGSTRTTLTGAAMHQSLDHSILIQSLLRQHRTSLNIQDNVVWCLFQWVWCL